MSSFVLNFGGKSIFLAILCVIFVFFFPTVSGPYSAVHGPVTVLRSVCARLKMLLVVLAVAFITGADCLLNSACALLAALPAKFFPSPASGRITVLRC
jgi:hypothetical protein